MLLRLRRRTDEYPSLLGQHYVPESAAALTPVSNQRRFVLAFLLSSLGLLAAVLTLNIVVDPFALAGTGAVPTAVESDRSAKLGLLQHLKHGPQILILGSSRSRQAEPSYLEKLTGLTGFNAGVTGGTTPDEYVFTRYAASLFPHQKRRYILFEDDFLATNGVNDQLARDPRARPYLPGGAAFHLGDVSTYLSTDATEASERVIRKCVLATCRPPTRFNSDGSLTTGSLRSLPERAKSLKESVAKTVAALRAGHQTMAQVRTDFAEPDRFVYLDRMLRFMNSRGEVPVIVLNPVYPTVFKELQSYGDPARRVALETIAKLHKHYRFVFVDLEDISKWGGTATDWTNATHVNRANMRRALRYVVEHADGALD